MASSIAGEHLSLEGYRNVVTNNIIILIVSRNKYALDFNVTGGRVAYEKSTFSLSVRGVLCHVMVSLLCTTGKCRDSVIAMVSGCRYTGLTGSGHPHIPEDLWSRTTADDTYTHTHNSWPGTHTHTHTRYPHSYSPGPARHVDVMLQKLVGNQ